jgi:acyl-CoA reductase-like NAD-dependent aldehyde dehydrogenase
MAGRLTINDQSSQLDLDPEMPLAWALRDHLRLTSTLFGCGREPDARRVASQLRAGRVVIDGMRDDPQAPWGGFKPSGVGSEYGRYGIKAFLEPRAILES